jgi:hypothetical protein
VSVVIGLGQADLAHLLGFGVLGLEEGLALTEKLLRVGGIEAFARLEKPAVVVCLDFAVVDVEDLAGGRGTRLNSSTLRLIMVFSFSSLCRA